MRSRICAWIVTSSAVVGSSAISTLGSQESARRSSPAGACRPRTRTDRSRRARGLAGCPRAPEARSRARGPRCRTGPRAPGSAPRSGRRSRCTGFSDVIGSWKIIAISRAADPAQLVLGGAHQIGALVGSRALEAGVGRAGQAHQRHRRDRLAGARLPHHGQHLAGGRSKDTPSTACTTPSSVANETAQVPDLEQRLGAHWSRIRGSR